MENIKALIRIVLWFLLFVSGITIFARLVTKWSASRRWHADDAIVVVALMFSVGSTIALSFAAEYGLGSPLRDTILSSNGAPKLEKAIFAAEILLILSILCCKLTVIELLRILFASPKATKLSAAFGTLLCLAATTNVLTVSFQCHVPSTWNLSSGKCIDLLAFWRYYSIMNIIEDLSLILLPIFMIRSIQMPTSKKAIVISCFLPWIFDTAANIVLIVYAKAFRTMTPETTLWPWYLCSQVVQSTSVLAGSIPYLRKFLEAFPSGMLKSSELGLGLTYADLSHDVSGEDSNRSFSLKEIKSQQSTERNPSFAGPVGSYQPAHNTQRAPYTEVNVSSMLDRQHGIERDYARQDHGMAINVTRSIDVRDESTL